MLSATASFYVDGEEIGDLQIDSTGGYDTEEGAHEYFVGWTGRIPKEDVITQVVRRDGDSVRDLFAMALVEVDAILAERAVN